MTFHTKRSPSQAKRFRACPGALAVCAALPEHQKNVSGEAAQRGTAVHGLIEHCLKHGKEPEEFRDRIIELIGDDERVSILRPNAKTPGPGRVFFVVDSDMIDGAAMMTEYVRSRIEELGGDECVKVQLETRTNPLPERDDTSGTADVTLDAAPALLEVVDYKNGWNVVEHKDNDQLLAYLLGKAIEVKFRRESFRITVVQPNAPHEEGRVRFVEATKAELLKFQKEYRADIKVCEQAEAAYEDIIEPADLKEWQGQYLAAGEHCLFCDAAPTCAARLALAEADAQADFADEPYDLPEPTNAAQAARIIAWAPRMESLIKAATMYAQRDMENGFPVPGLKLVRGKSTREWKPSLEEKEIVRSLVKGGWIEDKSKLYATKLISGPQAEKLIPKDRRDVFNDSFLHKPEGKLTVAPDSDPRPGIERHPTDDFEEADDYDFG